MTTLVEARIYSGIALAMQVRGTYEKVKRGPLYFDSSIDSQKTEKLGGFGETSGTLKVSCCTHVAVHNTLAKSPRQSPPPPTPTALLPRSGVVLFLVHTGNIITPTDVALNSVAVEPSWIEIPSLGWRNGWIAVTSIWVRGHKGRVECVCRSRSITVTRRPKK